MPLREQGALEPLERALLLASRMRTLVHEHRMLAHDLRAPLNAIHLSMELLTAALSEEIPVSAGPAEPAPQWQRHISVMHEEVERLQRTLAATLEQAEPIGPGEEAFDLRAIASEVARLLGPQARKRHVDIKVSLAETPSPVIGERESIRQALLNVVANALEVVTQGGLVSVSVREEPGRVLAVVQDTGPGIPSETLEEIYRLDWSTRKTGTDLYIARRVIETHGGSFGVENVPGRGTCFTLALPATGERRASQH